MTERTGDCDCSSNLSGRLSELERFDVLSTKSALLTAELLLVGLPEKLELAWPASILRMDVGDSLRC